MPNDIFITTQLYKNSLYQARIQDFFAGGVNDGRVQRAPSAPAPTGGGSRVDKHQIKVHSVHRIFRAIFVVVFFAIDLVKKFVEKKIGGQEQVGVTTPPPPGSAPVYKLGVS